MSYEPSIRRELALGCIAVAAPLVAGVASQLHYSGVLVDRRPHAFFTITAMLACCVALWRTLRCGYPMKIIVISGYLFITVALVAVTTLIVAALNGDSL